MRSLTAGARLYGNGPCRKNNLDGVVNTEFGDDVIRVLDRDNRLDLKGITLHLLTEKIQLRKLEGPVVAAKYIPTSS